MTSTLLRSMAENNRIYKFCRVSDPLTYLCGAPAQGALHQTQILALQMLDVQTAGLDPAAGPLHQAPAVCSIQLLGIVNACTLRIRPMRQPSKQLGIAAAQLLMASAEQRYVACAHHDGLMLRSIYLMQVTCCSTNFDRCATACCGVEDFGRACGCVGCFLLLHKHQCVVHLPFSADQPTKCLRGLMTDVTYDQNKQVTSITAKKGVSDYTSLTIADMHQPLLNPLQPAWGQPLCIP